MFFVTAVTLIMHPIEGKKTQGVFYLLALAKVGDTNCLVFVPEKFVIRSYIC